MKVLIVSNMYPGRNKDFEYAGIFVKEQIEELSNIDGVQCDLYVIDGFKSKLVYFYSALQLYHKLIFDKYDVIHVHYGLSGIFLLLNPFKKWSNVVVTLHGGDILPKQGKFFQVFITKLVIKKVPFVITLNEEMNKIVHKYNTNYLTLPCGIDDKLFDSIYLNRGNGVAIFPGNKRREVKNYSLFKSIILEYRKAVGEIEIVELDGFSREEVSQIMSRAKFLLMTSTSEGSPQVIKEAMSSDLCIISTDVGDVKRIVGTTPGTLIINDSLSDSEIVNKISTTISEASETPGLRKKRIESLQLSNYQVASKLLCLYKELIFA